MTSKYFGFAGAAWVAGVVVAGVVPGTVAADVVTEKINILEIFNNIIVKNKKIVDFVKTHFLFKIIFIFILFSIFYNPYV